MRYINPARALGHGPALITKSSATVADDGSGAIDGDDDSAQQAGDALVLTLGAGQVTLANVASLPPPTSRSPP